MGVIRSACQLPGCWLFLRKALSFLRGPFLFLMMPLRYSLRHLKRSKGLGEQIAGGVAAGDTVLCGDGFKLVQLRFR